MAPHQVVARARDHVADVGGPATVRVVEQAVAGEFVLAVEDRREAFGAAAQLRMRRDVGDPLAVDPDLALRPAQSLEKLRPRPRPHAALLRFSFPPWRSRGGVAVIRDGGVMGSDVDAAMTPRQRKTLPLRSAQGGRAIWLGWSWPSVP